MREDQQLRLWTDSREATSALDARYSPAYRWRLAGELAVDHGAIWAEYDIFSDTLLRTQFGVGLAWPAPGVEPFVRVALDIDHAASSLSLSVSYAAGNWRFGLQATVLLGAGPGLSLGYRAVGELGIGRW